MRLQRSPWKENCCALLSLEVGGGTVVYTSGRPANLSNPSQLIVILVTFHLRTRA